MADFAEKNDLIFCPSVGPGYLDTRIRPWNSSTTIERDNGNYYRNMFRSAIQVNPDFISITSFNEWHEGTQIEPAISKKLTDYVYEDYGQDTDPDYYLKLTKELIKQYGK
jgi:glycoprotein endo-alpha-1,2-mannosidase